MNWVLRGHAMGNARQPGNFNKIIRLGSLVHYNVTKVIRSFFPAQKNQSN